MTKSNLSYKIYRTSIFTNAISMFIMFIFSAFFSAFNLVQFIIGMGIASVLFMLFEFIIDPISNSIIFKSLDIMIDKWERGKINTEEERTDLLETLMKVPQRRGSLSFTMYALGSIFLCLFYHFLPQIKLPFKIDAITFFSTLFGSYNSTVFSHTYAETICNQYAEKIFSQGVSSDRVMKKKHFGISSFNRCFHFLIIPIINSNILYMAFVYLEYSLLSDAGISPTLHAVRMIVLTVTVVSIYLSFAILYFRYLSASNTKMTNTITEIITTGDAQVLHNSNLADEMQYNIFLINKTVEKFKNLITRANNIGKDILDNTKELSYISQSFAQNSIEQNAVIQGVSSNAEKSKEVSIDIQNNMIDVYIGVEQTNEEVEKSLITLNQSIEQLNLVKQVNLQNTQDIIALSKMIDNIDEVLIMIKDIADQTRIIAFNAELEAVSAKEEGKNFHIVASEIRRLASNTMNSIHAIEGHIVNLQNASLSLIAASENETNYINDQAVITEELKTHFLHIKDSAEETNKKALEIKEIINQQTTSFDQIAQTLMQIGEGFLNFTDSTTTISETAREIETAASMLSSIRDVRNEF